METHREKVAIWPEKMRLQAKKARVAGKHQKLEGRNLPYSYQKKYGPANTLALDFEPPALWDIKLLLS